MIVCLVYITMIFGGGYIVHRIMDAIDARWPE